MICAVESGDGKGLNTDDANTLSSQDKDSRSDSGVGEDEDHRGGREVDLER